MRESLVLIQANRQDSRYTAGTSTPPTSGLVTAGVQVLAAIRRCLPGQRSKRLARQYSTHKQRKLSPFAHDDGFRLYTALRSCSSRAYSVDEHDSIIASKRRTDRAEDRFGSVRVLPFYLGRTIYPRPRPRRISPLCLAQLGRLARSRITRTTCNRTIVLGTCLSWSPSPVSCLAVRRTRVDHRLHCQAVNPNSQLPLLW